MRAQRLLVPAGRRPVTAWLNLDTVRSRSGSRSGSGSASGARSSLTSSSRSCPDAGAVIGPDAYNR